MQCEIQHSSLSQKRCVDIVSFTWCNRTGPLLEDPSLRPDTWQFIRDDLTRLQGKLRKLLIGMRSTDRRSMPLIRSAVFKMIPATAAASERVGLLADKSRPESCNIKDIYERSRSHCRYPTEALSLRTLPR